MTASLARAAQGIVRVGESGRGFAVEGRRDRLIVTAAHCLPHMPPPMTFSYLSERTYAALLGPLGGKPTVWAECLFVDPISDLAVLGPPDGQVLPEECDGYERLTRSTEPLSIAVPKDGPVRILSLDGRWLGATTKTLHRGMVLGGVATEGGMSGSPIVNARGRAVGVVCSTTGSAEPTLMGSLPAWLLREISRPQTSLLEPRRGRLS